MVKRALLIAAVAVCPAIMEAQTSVATHPVYRRAQALVNDGDVATGRALVDSMLATAAPTSNDYAEGLYWRAVLSATAAEAEMDYRRIIVDFPISPRVEDALIRLAQLEIARANYDGALRHLNRLVVEHPESPSRPRASYWMARAMFDKNDLQGGCTALADAQARTTEGEAELRNQINYLNQRCAGVAISAQPMGPAALPPAPTTTSPPASVTAAPSVATAPPSAPPAAPAAATVPAPRDTTPRTVTAQPAAQPSAAPVRPAPAPPSAPATTPAAGARSWSVQVAALNQRVQAERMVASLKTNGYEARIDGSAAPFRVRIGNYATQGQANAVLRSLKAKNIDGYVVAVDSR